MIDDIVYTVNYNGVEIGCVYDDLETLCNHHNDLFRSYENVHYALNIKEKEVYKKGAAYIQKRELIRKDK